METGVGSGPFEAPKHLWNLSLTAANSRSAARRSARRAARAAREDASGFMDGIACVMVSAPAYTT